MAAVTIDAQLTPLIPDLRKTILSNVCVRTMAVFAIENDNFFLAPNLCGGEELGNYSCRHIEKKIHIPEHEQFHRQNPSALVV